MIEKLERTDYAHQDGADKKGESPTEVKQDQDEVEQLVMPEKRKVMEMDDLNQVEDKLKKSGNKKALKESWIGKSNTVLEGEETVPETGWKRIMSYY